LQVRLAGVFTFRASKIWAVNLELKSFSK